MKPVIFVHTHSRSSIAARVCAYSLRSRSRHSDAFEVRLLSLEDAPELVQYDGSFFRWRKGSRPVRWEADMPQSFVFLRRKVPELMNFEGRALLLDPDIIALADVWELLNHDMQGKALVCRPRANRAEGFHTAVMLMECNQLKHWRWRQHLEEIFQGERPVRPWFNLLDEDPATIGNLEEEWNDLDRVTEKTRMLHYTNVRTQPWLTGLPYRGHFVSRNSLFTKAINFFHLMGFHQPHAHEDLFLQLLRESIEHGEITKDEIEEQIRLGLFSPSLAATADD